MKIELEVSEPWDLPIGLDQTILLEAEDNQTSEAWNVHVVSGWNGAKHPVLSLRPRYEGNSLRDLLDGKSIFVNLVRPANADNPSEMVIGKASIIPELR